MRREKEKAVCEACLQLGIDCMKLIPERDMRLPD